MTELTTLTLAPLASTIERVQHMDENLVADIGAQTEGWFCAAELLCEGSSRLADCLARQAIQHPNMESRTKGSYFLGEYAWYMPAAAIAAYVFEQRVPDLSPDNIALRFVRYTWREGGESGEADRIEVRFLSGRFTCLPTDPDAAHPDAQVVPDSSALMDILREQLQAHFKPLIHQVYLQTRLGTHALWCLAADSFASLFSHLGDKVENGDAARRDFVALMTAKSSPMAKSKTHYVTLEQDGACQTFRMRGGCCRYYTVSDTAEKCSTCVLRPNEEREAMMRAYMVRSAAS